MNEKNVCQFDPDGWYVGLVIAYESPLEPGVWLIPGGAVDCEPPALIEAGKRYRLDASGAWLAEDIPADAEGA
jgi:hypothetical protein